MKIFREFESEKMRMVEKGAPSTAPVTIVTDSTDAPDYHVASVPYPFFLPDGKKARFYRVVVTQVP